MPNNPLNKVLSVSTMSYYTAIKKHISTEYKPMCIYHLANETFKL